MKNKSKKELYEAWRGNDEWIVVQRYDYSDVVKFRRCMFKHCPDIFREVCRHPYGNGMMANEVILDYYVENDNVHVFHEEMSEEAIMDILDRICYE